MNAQLFFCARKDKYEKINGVTIEPEKKGYVTSQTLSTSGYNGISDIVADLAKAESERRFPAVLV